MNLQDILEAVCKDLISTFSNRPYRPKETTLHTASYTKSRPVIE